MNEDIALAALGDGRHAV
jgi:SLT domain-containing protein